MKIRMIITTICAIALSFGCLSTAMAGGGIAGGPHDMNAYPGVTPDNQTRVCAFCHTPHHANIEDQAPLWSRPDTVELFDAYSSPTFSQDLAGFDPIAGPSRLCMSCHDGTIAIDTYYTAVNAATSGGFFGTTILIGDDYGEKAVGEFGDLMNDHPVGFDYDLAEAADNVGGAVNIHPATTVFDGSPTSVAIEDVLYDDGVGRLMTCSTCHDVHDGPDTGANGMLLYGTQVNSGICLSCHNK